MENNVQSLISIFRERNRQSNNNSKSFFAKDLEHYDFYLNAAELTLLALENPDLFDVYFTTSGWRGENDYIITEHNRNVNLIYKDLFPDNYLSYTAFLKETYPCDEEGMTDDYDNLFSDDKLSNGFFLDESTKYYNSPKSISTKKCLYTYKGPVYRFNNVYSRYWEGQVYATSEKQAEFLLNKKVKKEYGFVPNTNLSVDPRYIQLVQTQNSEAFSDPLKPRKCCKVCGTPLNDGGTCPVCDDGEEDY